MFKLYQKLPEDKKYSYHSQFKSMDKAVKRMYEIIDTWQCNKFGMQWQILDKDGQIIREYKPK